MHLCVYNHGYETIHVEEFPNLLQKYIFPIENHQLRSCQVVSCVLFSILHYELIR